LGDWFALEAPRSWVLRVESLFGKPAPGGKRLGSLGTILERIATGEEVPVFTDRTVSPSYTADIARATRAVLERGAAPGLYHCVNSGAASWADIAAEAARLMGIPFRMRPLTLDTAALKARRPRYCALSNAKLATVGIEMPTWQDALARYLDDDVRNSSA
jgi:dTDP-4-dehydrorhamnose reductase